MRSCTARSRAIAVKRPSAPPPRRHKQRRVSRRDLPDIVARDVGDDEDAGLRRIVERRGDARGASGSPADAAARSPPRRARQASVRVGLAVGQGRRGDDEAVRRLRHQLGKRDAGIDPVAVDRDVDLEPVDAVERQPLDRLRPGRLGEVAQQPAPRSRAACRRGARGRGSPRRGAGASRARAGFPGLRAVLRSASAQPAQRGGEPVERLGQRQRRLDQTRRPAAAPRPAGHSRLSAQRGARQHLLPHQRREISRSPGRPRAFGDALRPAVGRAGCGRRRGPRSAPWRRPRRLRRGRRCGAASRGRASRAGLGAEDPAPQLAPFLARQPHRKGAVGGLEADDGLRRRHSGSARWRRRARRARPAP